jgi:hypothetical protein
MTHWTRGEKIGCYGLVLAVGSLIAALLVVPEVRRLAGLERQPTPPAAESPQTPAREEPTPKPPTERSTPSPSRDTPYASPEQTWKVARYKLEIKLARVESQFTRALANLGLEPRIKKFREAYGREPSDRELDEIVDEVIRSAG